MEGLMVFIIMGLCGSIFIFLGYLIWIKGKINIIHAYHYTKVKEADKKAYTGVMGKAIMVMGIGMVAAGIICIMMHSSRGMMVFGIFF